MRDFLQEKVLYQSLPWAIIFTIVSAPRIIQGPFDPPVWPMIAFAFIVLMLAMGTVIAWGRQGGLAGFIPHSSWDVNRITYACILGVSVAVLLALADIPLKNILESHEKSYLAELSYPRHLNDWLILTGWNIGFTTVFFTCAGMALFSRVTRYWVTALVIVTGLRWISSMYRLSAYDLLYIWPVISATTVIFALSSCWLYARHGYPMAALFTFFTDLRHLMRHDFEC